MPDLSPSSYADFAHRLLSDSDLANLYRMKYARHLTSSSDCDSACRLSLYCDSMFIDPYLRAQCNGSPILDWTENFMGSFR